MAPKTAAELALAEKYELLRQKKVAHPLLTGMVVLPYLPVTDI